MAELELRVGDVVTHKATRGNGTVVPTPANLKALGEVNVMLHPGGSIYTTRVDVLTLKYRASDHEEEEDTHA